MVAEPRPSTDVLQQVGLTRTDMHCHGCGKDFIAIIDFDLTGDHEIECAHCGHIHYRGVKDGRVTESRYSSDNRPKAVVEGTERNVWKAKTQPIASASMASVFMRDLWLRRGD